MFKGHSKIFYLNGEIVPFQFEKNSRLSPCRGWVPVGIESQTGLNPFGVESQSSLCPFGIESQSGLSPFGVESIRGWVPSGLSPFEVGSSRGWVFLDSVILGSVVLGSVCESFQIIIEHTFMSILNTFFFSIHFFHDLHDSGYSLPPLSCCMS